MTGTKTLRFRAAFSQPSKRGGGARFARGIGLGARSREAKYTGILIEGKISLR